MGNCISQNKAQKKAEDTPEKALLNPGCEKPSTSVTVSVLDPLPEIFKSPYGEAKIPTNTIHQEMLAKCDSYGDRIAMVEAVSGEEWSFRKLAEVTRALAGSLASADFQPGDIVAVYMPNTPEYFAIFTGVISVGGVVTTINPAYGAAEMEHSFELTLPTYVFTVDALLPNALAAQAKVENLDAQFVILESKDKWTNVGENCRAQAFSELLKPGSPYTEATDPDALAALPYSSGTTGMPKGVMLTHRNVLSQIYGIAVTTECLGLTTDDTITAVLPFFHIYGMVILMYLPVWSGAKVVTLPKFVPDLYMKVLKEHNVTQAHVAPPLANFLAKHPAVDAFLPLPSLKGIMSGAAPLGSDLAEAARSRLKCDVVRQGYGMTELSGASHVGPMSNPKSGSIGYLVAGFEMKLISTVTEKPVTKQGEEGEIWLAGPAVMKGYYKNEAETKATVDEDGFLHTGDVGVLDEDGQIWVVDRIKELIKNKGFQVAPAELEAVLVKHPKIGDAAVIGVAAGFSYGGKSGDGQVPKAFVVRTDPTLTEPEVKDFIKRELDAHYKQLGGVEFVETIPKSASGKILRKDLRKMEEANGGKVFA